ncbi:hypothetical protein O181_099030 [Austropuccinia psidii MF-1]|uniref:Uncharacterized protein n=1 Tax=Austropuccinia psidii MF-1 TaxID=1389203 RepID=A0A9Q3JCU0_9BASI|nr:hypothetical protein [Austropuccinia psidii MF-1]
MPSTRSGASYNPSSSSQKKGHRCDYGRSQSVTEGKGSVDDLQINKFCHSEADNTILPSNRAETATRSLSGNIQSQPEGLQQCIAAQIVPDPCRSVEKLHEFLPDCEKIHGPSQHLQVTQRMASIDGKEEHDAFNSRMEEKQPSTTHTSAKNSPSSQQQQMQSEKATTSSKKGQRQGTSHKTLQTGLQNPKHSEVCHGECISDGQNNDRITEKGGSQIKISEMISEIFDYIPELYEAIKDIKSHVSDKNSSICNNLKTNNLTHRWYIKLRQAHGHQSWTWWKTQIINKWANDAWRFKVETAFESSKFNSDKDKALPWFCKQKDRLTALYPDMSEFMIHRKILRQCGGDLKHSFKSRTTEKSSAEDIIDILEEVTTRTKIGSTRVNLKARFNRPWKDSMDKNPKENSNNVKHKPADIIIKCHICQSTTHLANTCPKRGKINEIDIEKEPDVEKDNNIEENSDDKS